MDVSDITFVGSGIATTVTLIELFDKLINAPAAQQLTITVIEKNEELWLGVPYGSRSSVNALSITHVHDFVYESERPLFFEWLKDNKDNWAGYYREHGGITAARWLENNMPLIENEDWETVYIPRFILGKYLLEKFTRLLRTAQEKQLLKLKTIQAEAIDVKTIDGGLHEVVIEHPDKTLSNIVSHKLVLSIGSGPVKKMFENRNDNILYINDVYEPSVNHNIKAVHKALSTIHDPGDRNVLVIGSNASSIELLYLLEGMHDLRKLINKTVVISPSGQLPYHISTKVIDPHTTPSLDKLKADGNYTIETLIEATSKDLKLAVQDGANVDYIATVIKSTLQLLEVLGHDAKKAFIGIYGMKLSHMFRRSGPEYKNGSDLLIELQEAVLLKGKFIDCEASGNGGILKYIDSVTGKEHTYALNFKVIINCSGSENLIQSTSRLIQNLIKKNICKINLSNKGFDVNENFETAPNLYIMGPMLGGNMNKLIHFWHLENAPRLMYLAPHLAETLLGNQ